MEAGRRPAVTLLIVAAVAGCGSAARPASDTRVVKSGSAPTRATPKATKKPARAAAFTRTAKRTRSSTPAERRGSAAAALATLPVKGRAPKTGYSREQFDDGWASADGCDTRDRILTRDLTDKAYLDDCRVESGKLDDPYTAARVTYQRGGASEVDIDHVVALGDAWQKGAQQWSRKRRVHFANDPLNLLAVDASANRRKGDGDAATWLPANKRFRCDYVARQVAVKTEYHAWVTPAEHDAIARVLATCPAQRLPKGGRVRVPLVSTHTEPAPAAAPKPEQRSTGSSSGGGHVYANCDAARAAGAAPVRRGTPDYAANQGLDRDGDGVACESGSSSSTASGTPTGSSPGGGHVYVNCDAVRAAGAAPLQRGTADYAANERLDRDGDGLACE
jgi:hypothetical protein